MIFVLSFFYHSPNARIRISYIVTTDQNSSDANRWQISRSSYIFANCLLTPRLITVGYFETIIPVSTEICPIQRCQQLSMLCHFLPTAYCRHFVRMVVFGRIEQKNNQSRMVGTMGFLPPFIMRVVPHLHNASIFHPFVFLMLRIIMTRIWVFSFIFSLI